MKKGINRRIKAGSFFDQHADSCPVCTLMAGNECESRPLTYCELMWAFAEAKRMGKGAYHI